MGYIWLMMGATENRMPGTKEWYEQITINSNNKPFLYYYKIIHLNYLLSFIHSFVRFIVGRDCGDTTEAWHSMNTMHSIRRGCYKESRLLYIYRVMYKKLSC